MYLHPAHAQPLARTLKPSDHSLDTSTESDDSGLLQRRAFHPASTSYIASKAKHSLCRNFTEQGFCSYGKRCQFAHGLEELYSGATGKSSYKTKICMAFVRDGCCFYGQRCNFIHEAPRVRTQDEWARIYRNFREDRDMFAKEDETKGRLMRILGKSEE